MPRKNSLWALPNPVFIYTLVSISMLLLSQVHIRDAQIEEIQQRITLDGILVHLGGVGAYLIGSYWSGLFAGRGGGRQRQWEINAKAFSLVFYACCAISLVVLVVQIRISVQLGDYYAQLMRSISTGAEDPNLRQPTMLGYDEGGLPGYIKMFSFTPLAAAMLLVVREFVGVTNVPGRRRDSSRSFHIALFLSVLTRSLLTLDRGMAMMYILILAYGQALVMRRDHRSVLRLFTNPWVIMGGLTCIALGDAVSELRQGLSLLGVLVQYSSLGLANLSLVLQSNFDHTFGLNTFYVLVFMMKSFGVLGLLPVFVEPEYIWNPAKYLTAYVFIDFGYFYFIFFFVYGWVTSVTYRRVIKCPTPLNAFLLLAIVTSLLGSFSIPPFRSAEWWTCVVIGILAAKTVFRRSPESQRSRPPNLVAKLAPITN